MHRIWRTIRNRGIFSVRMRLCAGLGLAVLLALVFGLTGRSQTSGSNGGQGQGNMRPHFPQLDSSSDVDVDSVTAQRRMRALNIERQKQMVSDTDKLLKLAKELNEEVAAQNTGTLTSAEMRKIADIEKLARNVRQMMTDGAGEPQSTIPPPIIYLNH